MGNRLGPLLVQLPPSLAFERRVAVRFFDLLRTRYEGVVVCEPRHHTWFSADAESVLVAYKITRVAADPPTGAGAELPGGWKGLVYFRLHGSPRKYWSRYGDNYIRALAAAILAQTASVETWCVFDNTASGAALENAWDLRMRLLAGRSSAGT